MCECVYINICPCKIRPIDYHMKKIVQLFSLSLYIDRSSLEVDADHRNSLSIRYSMVMLSEAKNYSSSTC